MMEKRGVIEPGRTPPETETKAAADLEEHVTKRAADTAAQRLAEHDERPSRRDQR